MAVVARTPSLMPSHPIHAFDRSSISIEGEQQQQQQQQQQSQQQSPPLQQRPLRHRSLKRSQGSIEGLDNKRHQHAYPDSHPHQLPWGGTSMRVGNISQGRMELRPVPFSFQSPHRYPDSVSRASQSDMTWRDSFFSTDTTSTISALPVSFMASTISQPSKDSVLPHARIRARSLSTPSDDIGQTPQKVQPLMIVDKPTTVGAQYPWVYNKNSTGSPPGVKQDGTKEKSTSNSDKALRTSFKSTSTAARNYPPSSSHSSKRRLDNTTNARNPRDATASKSLDRTTARVSRSVDSTSHRRRTLGTASQASTNASQPVPDTTTTLELEAPPTEGEPRSLVCVSNLTGQVMGATSTGLVAQITSPSFLDYDLLSDFFLTFRSYMSTSMLMDTLMIRMAWAMSRKDDFGRIVRVRVFVALRHWILNYFPDDFLEDLALRKKFCDMVNRLTLHVTVRESGGEGDLKVIGELKKCWRRTCALYWTVLEHRSSEAKDDIFPGGDLIPVDKAGRFQEATIRGKAAVGETSPLLGPGMDQRLLTDETGALNQKSQKFSLVSGNEEDSNRPQLHSYRDSDQSTHVVSCSLPALSNWKSRPKTAQTPLSPSNAIFSSSDIAAGKERQALAKRGNARPNHSRTGSFADTTRDAGLSSTIPSVGYRENPLKRKLSLAGNLIRGLSIEPLGAAVTTTASLHPLDTRSSLMLSDQPVSDANDPVDKMTPTPTVSKKRFLGGVRKALAGRHTQYHDNDTFHPRTAESYKDSHSKVATSPQEDETLLAGVQVGIDILAAKASNAYRDALQKPVQASHEDDARVQATALPPQSIVPDRFVPTEEPSAFFIDKGAVIPGRNSVTSSVDAQVSPLNVNDRLGQAHGGRGILSVSSRKTQTLKHAKKTLEDTRVSSSRDPASVSPNMPGDKDQLPQLKRMPGGNLRKADHVHSLVQKSKTFSTFTSELELDLAASPSRFPKSKETPAPVTGNQDEKKISLMSGGSQPNMRPSFEKEVAKLRQLPDSPDDGGVEAALQKLEGKVRGVDLDDYETATPLWEMIEAQAAESTDEHNSLLARDIRANIEQAQNLHRDQDSFNAPYQQREQESRPVTFFADQDVTAIARHGDVLVDEEETNKPKHSLDDTGPESRPRTFFADESELELAGASVRKSTHTDHSTPLLERGVSQQAARRRRSSSDWLTVSLPQQVPRDLAAELAGIERISAVHSGDAVSEVHEIGSVNTHQSFLLDHHQSLGPGRKILSKSPPIAEQPTESFFVDDNTSILSGNQPLSHPLRLSTTPPRTLNWLSEQSVEILPPSILDHPPSSGFRSRTSAPGAAQADTEERPRTAIQETSPTDGNGLHTSHIPFILGYPSTLLAQQFALIEKDALSEVDWRELIDLRWKQSADLCQTWSDCLSPNAQARTISGVDLCIARFNMVVNWCASEVVLCQDLDERAACIIKYIHIAQHARRMQNWATMYQIATSLVSADISRLKKTWEQVPQAEKDILDQLEDLIMPMRNFQNLRSEIERASLTSDTGCIPFIGIYTHDLIFNAQKPQFSLKTDGLEAGERLINFDKHRTAAGIVKNLLRMLDASSKYDFEPVLDVLSRCLWIACLGKDEISARSKHLEP